MQVATLQWEECGGWLYAFVVDEAVKYIGLTSGVLRTRLDQYRDGSDSYGHESQCGRIKAEILRVLSAGHAVVIYGCRRPQWTKEALRVDERALIDEYRPTGIWNRA
jgi:hypothetical protein